MLTQGELNWLMEPTTSWLEGSTIQRVYSSRQPYEWCLQLRRPGESRYLLICTHPDAARLHFTRGGKPPQPQHPTSFTMLLRKWLQGMVIRHVDAPADDRIVRLRGDVRSPEVNDSQSEGDDERDERPPTRIPVELVMELHGRHAMLFLLRQGGVILGQSSSDRLPGRSLQPGQTYEPLPQDPFASDQSKAQNRFLPAERADAQSELDHRHELVEGWFDVNLDAFKKQHLLDTILARLRRHEKKLTRLIHNIEGDLQRVEEAR